MTEIQAIITWDLEKNLEDRSLEIKEQPQIQKGVQSNLNYINLKGVSFDLEFAFPLKFFDDWNHMTVSYDLMGA